MKRRSEHDELWSDLFSENTPAGFREMSLDRTLRSVRQHQRCRRICRLTVIAASPCVLALGLVLWPGRGTTLSKTTSGGSAAQASAVVPGTHIRLITDDELFAMFPNRPMALLGSANDRQFVLLDEVPKPAPQTSPATPPQRL
jgi:hypothetical protein